MPEQMGHVTADRADVRTFQFEFGEIVQLIKPERAVHGEFVRVDFLELGLVGVEFVLNVADQFLQHVFQRHHSNRPAEFVDHDCQVQVFTQKKTEQFLERHHLGDRNQFAFDPQHIGIRIAHHRHEFLDVNEPDCVVEVLATKRKARVL